MLLAACARTRPTSANAKWYQFKCSVSAAASNPPIKPEVIVIEKTAARVMINHLLTTSISLSGERFTVSSTSFQFESRDMNPLKFVKSDTRSGVYQVPYGLY